MSIMSRNWFYFQFENFVCMHVKKINNEQNTNYSTFYIDQ